VRSCIEDAIRARKNSCEIATEKEVSNALDRMASEASEFLCTKNPVVLAVMRGGAFTAVELCCRFDFPHEFDFIHVSRYDKNLKGGNLSWFVLPKENLQGRVVLVVDDILDEGKTLQEIHEKLYQYGVSMILSAVLVKKKLKSIDHKNVNFVGVEIEDVYVFGCGLDYKGYWRGLKSLHSLGEY
tara:strand:+ start:429 stop:980 length:552 start_codon:yes stop_codon:yes gene_type:complete